MFPVMTASLPDEKAARTRELYDRISLGIVRSLEKRTGVTDVKLLDRKPAGCCTVVARGNGAVATKIQHRISKVKWPAISIPCSRTLHACLRYINSLSRLRGRWKFGIS